MQGTGRAGTGIEPLDSRVAQSLDVERLLGRLTLAFGAAALGLACLGLHGTMTYAVRQRTSGLGLRLAPGADRICRGSWFAKR